MLSRVADNLYWLARYVERAENTARLILVNSNLDLDLPRGVSPVWKPLVEIVSAAEILQASGRQYSERSVIAFLVGDYGNPGSIVSTIAMARENARTARDMIPREIWEHVNDLHLYVGEHLKGGLARAVRHERLQHVIQAAQTFTGMLEGTLNTGVGHRFLCLGRYLERADMTSRIVDVRSSSLLHTDITEGLRPFENIQWMSVLKSLTGYQMYRLKKRVRVRQEAVLEFLLADDEFPRSIAYCVGQAEAQLRRLPAHEQPLLALARVRDHLDARQVPQMTAAILHAYIDELQLGLADVHTALVDTYFAPKQTSSGESPTERGVPDKAASAA